MLYLHIKIPTKFYNAHTQSQQNQLCMEAYALLRSVGCSHAQPDSQSFGLHLPSNQTKPKRLKDFLQQEQWVPPPCPIPLFLGTGRIPSHIIKGKREGGRHDHIL